MNNTLATEAAAPSAARRRLIEERLRGHGVESRDGSITRRTPRPDPSPLSFAQERLWFLESLNPGTSSYNIANGVRLTGALDIPALEQSINRIVSRQGSPRTRSPSIDGEPRQIIEPPYSVPLSFHDLSG